MVAQPGPASARAADLVLTAEEHLEADRPDEAIVQLWHAERRLATDGDSGGAAAGDTLRDIVHELLRNADPLDRDRRTLATQSATKLVALARSYSRKKWHRVALAILDEAEALAPGSSGEARIKIAAKTGGRATPAAAMPAPLADLEEPKTVVDLLQELKEVEFVGKWRRDATGIRSPKLGPSAMVLARKPTHGDDDIEIEVRLGAHGKAALVFGIANSASYYIAELNLLQGGRSCLSVFHLTGRIDMARLGETYFDLPPDSITKWLRLRVEVRGTTATTSVDGIGQTTVQCPTLPRGGIGLFVSDTSENKNPVQFRNLSITAPPLPTDPATGALTPEARVAQGIADAEAMFAANKAEDGVLELGQLRRILATTNGDRSSALAERIDALLAEHDVLHKAQDKARHEIAASYRALGQRYLDGKHPRAALVLFEYSLHHDRVAAAQTVADLRAAVTPTTEPAANAPAGATPADATAAPGENAELREWFEGGRQLNKAGWQWTDDHLASPQIESGNTLYLSEKKISGRGQAQVQIRMSGGACAGFVFARRSNFDYYLLSLEQNASGSAFAVTRQYSNQWHTIARQQMVGSLPRDAWVQVSVEYGDDELVFTVADEDPLHVKREEFHLRGATTCALYVWADSIAGSAQFRNLKMQMGPKD